MSRLLIAVLLTATALAAAIAASPASAAATERCRPRSGEHTLARSAQAVVLQEVVTQSQHFPLQTLIGCSRRSGKRRTLETLQRRTADDPTKLIGVKLAGTRVAYAMLLGDVKPTLIADDALHGGRRHDLSSNPKPGYGSGWPFGSGTISQDVRVAWAVDPQGDVAWIVTETTPQISPISSSFLGVYRAGLGRRMVDSHAATLGDLTLHDGVLRWRRNGRERTADLTQLPPSRCGTLNATIGTLEVDVVPSLNVRPWSACLRATGQTVSTQSFSYEPEVVDANGPYVVLYWMHKELSFRMLADLAQGTVATERGSSRTVVDEHGSLAWIEDGGLWVRDATGTRRVADGTPNALSGPLLRDGSTVTWPGGGPTVTLNP